MSFNISSNFFNSMLGRSSGNSNSMTGLLSDYNSIRNGSYLKLAKHYYSKDGAKQATQKQFSNNISTKSEDKLTKSASESAWKDITTLRNEKMYQTEDTDTVLKNVKSFVDSYNSVIEGTQKSDNSNVQKDAARLASQTDNYANALSKIGITIKDDNTLSLNEETFASADMADVKKLFAGDFSFGSNTQNRLMQLVNDATAYMTSGIYNTSGTIAGAFIGNFYDSLF